MDFQSPKFPNGRLFMESWSLATEWTKLIHSKLRESEVVSRMKFALDIIAIIVQPDIFGGARAIAMKRILWDFLRRLENCRKLFIFSFQFRKFRESPKKSHVCTQLDWRNLISQQTPVQSWSFYLNGTMWRRHMLSLLEQLTFEAFRSTCCWGARRTWTGRTSRSCRAFAHTKHTIIIILNCVVLRPTAEKVVRR